MAFELSKMAKKIRDERLAGANEKLAALLGAGAEELNPPHPPLTEREEENPAVEKFVVPEKFEGPEYDAVKKAYDGINKFLASKGIDPARYTLHYRAVFKTKPHPNKPDHLSGELEEFENYHDYLKRLQSLTIEEKNQIGRSWASQLWGDWTSPGVFSNISKDLNNPDSELYQYREEIYNIIEAQRDGAAEDLYAEAVKMGEVKEIGKEINGTKEELPTETDELEEETEEAGKEKLKEKTSEVVAAEAALDKAREDYVAAIFVKEKADKGVEKLNSLWGKFKDWAKHHPLGETVEEKALRKDETKGGVMAEQAEAQEKLSAAQDALRLALKDYRDRQVADKEAELGAAGKSADQIKEEMEKYAKEIFLATTLAEAGRIDMLKSDRQIEQMGSARRFINESVEGFANWYRALPVKYKIAVSAGLMVGGGAFGLVGSQAIIAAAFAGQGALRVLGGSMMAAGAEGRIKISQEKQAEKKLSKEFAGKFLETLKNQNYETDEKLFALLRAKQSEKTRRFIIAGAAGALVGTGALAQAARNVIDWFRAPLPEGVKEMPAAPDRTSAGGVKSDIPATPEVRTGAGITSPESSLQLKGGGIKGGGAETLPADTGAETTIPPTAQEAPAPSVATTAETTIPSTAETTVVPPAAETTAPPVEAPAIGREFAESLPIGRRGPEGAIIDYFKANADAAKHFGWDGKNDITEWAGPKAHRMWLEWLKGELANSRLAEELSKHGYSVDADGYDKAMRHIGKGFVDLDSEGRLSISDKTSFLKAPVEQYGVSVAPEAVKTGAAYSGDILGSEALPAEQASELAPVAGRTPAVPAPEMPVQGTSVAKTLSGEEALTSGEKITEMTPEQYLESLPPGEKTVDALAAAEVNLADQKIKHAVSLLVSPDFLKDATFKAAAKVPLGKIMDEIPPDVYDNKYSLNRYWQNISAGKAKFIDLPGTGFFGQWGKDLNYDDFRKYAEMAKFLREGVGEKAMKVLRDMSVEDFFKKYGGGLKKK